MKTIKDPSRTIPVIAETDVLVVGGGPGGLSAALASARESVDTMLVERYGCFGGVITQSMIGTPLSMHACGIRTGIAPSNTKMNLLLDRSTFSNRLIAVEPVAADKSGWKTKSVNFVINSTTGISSMFKNEQEQPEQEVP